jgi:hypothetical protein
MERHAYKVLIWQVEGKIPLDNNIKMGLKDIDREGVQWIHVA